MNDPLLMLDQTVPQNFQQNTLPPASLSAKAKESFVESLKAFDSNELKLALLDAALSLCRFPNLIDQEFLALQQSWKTFQYDENVGKHIQQAIIAYIETKGIQKFTAILQSKFLENDWTTELIFHLATTLKLEIKEEPIVQVTIIDGKIFWRVLKGNKVIHTQPKARPLDIKFDGINSWSMTWDQFRLFKNSGKRTGNVAVTKERFVRYFAAHRQPQAEAVWLELKRKGILNNRDRFSSAWRAMTNQKVLLETIDSPPDDLIITKKIINDYLKKLRNDNVVVTRERFTSEWGMPYQEIAGVIWDHLKAIGIIDGSNYVGKLSYSIAGLLDKLPLNYNIVADALYTIANNPENSEKIAELPAEVSYRPERSRKTWNLTGSVENNAPGEEQHCTNIWDVGVYKDLSLHRNSKKENERHNNEILNYDHIPSSAIIKSKMNEFIQFNLRILESYEAKLKALELDCNNYQAQLQIRRGVAHFTRLQATAFTDETLQDLYKQKVEVETKIEQYKSICAQLGKEINNKNADDYWWAIAVPGKLHTQGESFMRKLQEQQKLKGHPFYQNLYAYLQMLEDRPQDFSLTFDDYIKALGAFRFLYRQQVKMHSQLDGKYILGLAPQSFFVQQSDKDAIDKLLSDKIKYYIERKEGLKPHHDINVNPNATPA